ncbi:MAG: hypothetical protein ACE10A_11295 [Acidiferrobacterales bacterium]
MTNKKHTPTKDRRKIGEVTFLIEEMTAARAASASCIHVEAALEPDNKVSFSKKKSSHHPVREKIRSDTDISFDD